MIEIRVPKDIRKYKTKIVGPFTARNIVGLGIGLACGGLSFAILKSAPSDVKLFVVMIFAIPGILIGWANFYGMPFEEYAKVAIINNFLTPQKILYKTKNEFDVPAPNVSNKKKKKEKFKSKNPEFKKYS